MEVKQSIGRVGITLSDVRIVKNLEKAQRWLDSAVLIDSTPYVPFSSGVLRRSGHVIPGGGGVEWNTPYAHYLYVGEIYGPNIPIKDAAGNVMGYWSPPKKQPTGRPLQYKEPGTGPEWFEQAKQANLQSKWLPGVKRIVGQG